MESDPDIVQPIPQPPVFGVPAPAWDRQRIKAMFWGTGVFVILYVLLIIPQLQGTALLFLVLPFFSAWIVANTVSRREHVMSTCFLSLLVNCLASYLFLGEGILCVVMASPILALLTFLGSLVGRAGRFPKPNNNIKRMLPFGLLGGLLIFSTYDAVVLAYGAPIRTVTTRTELAASKTQVWKSLTFDRVPSVPIGGWLGKLLPPPDRYRFHGEGLGARRVMDYGAIRWGDDGDTPRGTVQFVVSKWEPDHAVEFQCVGNTTRINKWIGLLDTRVELEPASNGTHTMLILTTHYRRHLGPAFYFNSVLDYGVEKMHELLSHEVRHGLEP